MPPVNEQLGRLWTSLHTAWECMFPYIWLVDFGVGDFLKIFGPEPFSTYTFVNKANNTLIGFSL